MRAIVCESFTSPDSLKTHEMPQPVPEPNQVLIKVEATGLGYVDALTVAGLYQIKPRLPFIPGNMLETVVPVTLGGQVIAQLATGQISHEKLTRENFDKFIGTLGEDTLENVNLERAYLETSVVSEEKYRAMVTLLAAFSLQLSELADQIVLELRHEKSDPIACAKDYIDENLCETIILDEVASEIHMSRFYLCRRFKESTGMTLTEYVSNRRVEMAKEMLENTSLRVADIAFEVGFQSLSQFNRTFHRVAQNTPTQFRTVVNAA